MDQYIQRLFAANHAKLIAGLPLEWDSVPEDKRERIILIALHCCLNGPVGVNKETQFPCVGRASIKGLVNVSNSGWKGLCARVAAVLAAIDPKIDCSQYRQHGKYWPL